MSFFTRLAAGLAILATFTPLVAASCSNNEFWYEDRSCCLPHGGSPSPPSPPKGNDCPSGGWYWHDEQKCCVPSHPSPPPPTCNNSWSWDQNESCCKPPAPKPSGHSWGKRSSKSRSLSLCPTGTDACPVGGLTGGDYECIDTTVELESCGGCASIGEGQDCSAIPGAWNVGCEQGRCAVYTCAAGFRRTANGKSCKQLGI